jgi:ATP-dependent DNA helicase RecG
MESQTTEYKQQWSDKYLAYISGFANAQGGTLYVGINDAGESWGRGYEKISDAFEKEKLQIPVFEQVRGGVLATIQREIFVALNKQNVGDVSEVDQVNDQVNHLQLSENERKVFYLIKESDQVNDQVTTSYIAQKLGLSYSTIKRVLRVLKQKNVVHRVGSDKTGFWQVKDS